MNQSGVTLVEVMIALVILLIVFLGLIQASLLTIEHNLRNDVRDEGVRVASEYMSKTRSLDFISIPSSGSCTVNDCNDSTAFAVYPASATAPNPVDIKFRSSATAVSYTVGRCICDLDAQNKKIGIRVDWVYRGDNSHQIIYSSVGSGS